jgi:hypothetical protein
VFLAIDVAVFPAEYLPGPRLPGEVLDCRDGRQPEPTRPAQRKEAVVGIVAGTATLVPREAIMVRLRCPIEVGAPSAAKLPGEPQQSAFTHRTAGYACPLMDANLWTRTYGRELMDANDACCPTVHRL